MTVLAMPMSRFHSVTSPSGSMRTRKPSAPPGAAAAPPRHSRGSVGIDVIPHGPQPQRASGIGAGVVGTDLGPARDVVALVPAFVSRRLRSEEHTSELQSLR